MIKKIKRRYISASIPFYSTTSKINFEERINGKVGKEEILEIIAEIRELLYELKDLGYKKVEFTSFQLNRGIVMDILIDAVNDYNITSKTSNNKFLIFIHNLAFLSVRISNIYRVGRGFSILPDIKAKYKKNIKTIYVNL